jgi:hypothetical protein
MPDADVGTFTVTPEALVDLAARISAVRDQLDATRDLVDDVSGALGSASLASALEHFVSGWRDGRKQVSTEVGALSDMFVQAAGVYSDTENALASAIPAGGS